MILVMNFLDWVKVFSQFESIPVSEESSGLFPTSFEYGRLDSFEITLMLQQGLRKLGS